MGNTRGLRAANPRSGWTLLEIVLATLFLLIVVVGFAYGLASSTSLGVATKELGLAEEGLRAKVEELRGTDFAEVLARYDPSSADDPATGASPGPNFDVPGLSPRADDPDGHVGEIVFPLDANGNLREDMENDSLGMPRDLTGEGDVDDQDHSADYHLLPVLVRLRWRGTAGNAAFEAVTFLKRMHP